MDMVLAELGGAGFLNLPQGGGDISLGITGASVGQYLRVKTVDANGKPTAYETVTLPNAETEEY